MPLPLYLLDVAEATAPQHIRFTDPERSHRAPDLDGDAYRHGGAGGGAPSGAGPSSPIPEPDPDAAIRFIRTAFPGGDWPGHVLIWTLDRRSQRKTSHWVASPGEAETTVRAHAGLWTPSAMSMWAWGCRLLGLRTGSGPGDLSPHRRLLKGPRLDEQGGRPTHAVSSLHPWSVGRRPTTARRATVQAAAKQYIPTLESALERLKEIQIQPTIPSTLRSRFAGILEGIQPARGRLHWTGRLRPADRPTGYRCSVDVYSPYSIDSVSDLSRVMRLPSFIKGKSGNRPVSVEIHHQRWACDHARRH